jgi:GWxTD domain-containing protein
MNKRIALLLIVSFYFTPGRSNTLTAFFSTATFNSPAAGPYVETYLSVMGSSVRFAKNASGKYQSSIEVSIAFMQDSLVKNHQKYNLLSPEVTDTTKAFPDFTDLQRYTLPNGSYQVELTIADKYNNKKPFSLVQALVVNIDPLLCNFSSVEFLESVKATEKENLYSKSGYDLIPYVSSYYPKYIDNLDFYCELYNADKELGNAQKFIVSYYIENFESKIKLASFYNQGKQTSAKVNIIIGSFSIKELPSGNYNLVIEARNKENELKAVQKQFFQRNNPNVAFDMSDINAIPTTGTFVEKYTDKDTLLDYIRSLKPISSMLEKGFIDNQAKNDDVQTLQKFFYGFWLKRNAQMPEKQWNEYYQQVKAVNKEFSSGRIKGYNTDRGRVYLQYGPPNYRSAYLTEPNSYPYEIWQYQRVNSQTNRKFVFYNTDLASNNFKLLHSDAIGETYENRWQMILTRRTNPGLNLDEEKAPSQYGSHMDDNFNDPR